MGTGNTVTIGMADLRAVNSPDSITTIGLGSCVGICLYDNKVKVIGMAHAMLPDSTKIIKNDNKAKFVDTSITKLIEEMTKLGASKNRLVAKIAGGAQMFAYTSSNESMRIGDRNVEAAIANLQKLGIPILSKDVGSNYGRTIIFSSETGIVTVKTVSNGTKDI